MSDEKPKKPAHKRRTLGTAAVQGAMSVIAGRIQADAAETDAEKKLKPRELIGLSNSMASLGRLLQESDRDRLLAGEGKGRKKDSPFA